jgi:hypothetical protein
MSTQDLVHNVAAAPGWAGATINSNTDTDSALVIDTQGFDSSMFAVHSGTWTDGAFQLKIMETDNPDGTTGAAEVASYQQQDTLGASNVVKKVGARANKRYQKLRITSTGVTTGCVFKSAVSLLAGAKNSPVA